ncbi:MAG TPA: hypothetical protein VFR49_11280, partial [Solirubrobacteraceae bacterium]|nr:hypothetical protein [Solirubrobacteraceae bacterium]
MGLDRARALLGWTPVLLASAGLAAAPAATAGSGARLAQASDIGVSIEPGSIGFLSIAVTGPLGKTVSIAELMPAGGRPLPIATVILHRTTVLLRNAVAWRCTDLDPTIIATESSTYGGAPPARASRATPSCAHRLSVAVVPTRLHAGYPATVAVSDTWRQGGLRVRGCLGRRCATETLRPRQAAFIRLRPRYPGSARLTVSDPYEQIDRRLPVRGGRPLVLATGDSEMQVLDDILAGDLAGPGGARVIGDARQSTAITSPSFFDWPAHGAQQV